jgi:hypothetical protein
MPGDEFPWPQWLKDSIMSNDLVSRDDLLQALPGYLAVRPDVQVQSFLTLNAAYLQLVKQPMDAAAYRSVANALPRGMLATKLDAALRDVATAKRRPEMDLWRDVTTNLSPLLNGLENDVTTIVSPKLLAWRAAELATPEGQARMAEIRQAERPIQTPDLEVGGPEDLDAGWAQGWGQPFVDWASGNEWRGALTFWMTAAPDYRQNPSWSQVRDINDRFLASGSPENAWLSDGVTTAIIDTIRPLLTSKEIAEQYPDAPVIIDTLADGEVASPPADLFDDAVEEVHHYLRTDAYPKFRAAFITEWRNQNEGVYG